MMIISTVVLVFVLRIETNQICNFATNKHPCAQSHGGSEHPEKVDEDAIPRKYKIGPEVNLLQKEL